MEIVPYRSFYLILFQDELSKILKLYHHVFKNTPVLVI